MGYKEAILAGTLLLAGCADKPAPFKVSNYHGQLNGKPAIVSVEGVERGDRTYVGNLRIECDNCVNTKAGDKNKGPYSLLVTKNGEKRTIWIKCPGENGGMQTVYYSGHLAGDALCGEPDLTKLGEDIARLEAEAVPEKK